MNDQEQFPDSQSPRSDKNVEPIEALEPRPMKAKPALQSLSWVAGVAAGGLLAFLLVVTPSVSRGATRAGKAAWQLRNPKPGDVSNDQARVASTRRQACADANILEPDDKRIQKDDDHARRDESSTDRHQ